MGESQHPWSSHHWIYTHVVRYINIYIENCWTKDSVCSIGFNITPTHCLTIHIRVQHVTDWTNFGICSRVSFVLRGLWMLTFPHDSLRDLASIRAAHRIVNPPNKSLNLKIPLHIICDTYNFDNLLVCAFCFHMLQFLMVLWKPTCNGIYSGYWLICWHLNVFIQYWVCLHIVMYWAYYALFQIKVFCRFLRLVMQSLACLWFRKWIYSWLHNKT